MIKTEKGKQSNKSSLFTKDTKYNKQAQLSPGNLIKLKITALGTNNVGINEFSFGIPVLVPNARLGDTVIVKILKVLTSKKLAIAKLIQVVNNQQQIRLKNPNLPQLTSGTTLDVTINKLGPNSTGIVDLSNTYNNVTKLIVKKPLLNINEQLSVTVTRVKKDYAFAVALGFQEISQVNLNKGALRSPVIQKTGASFKGTKFTVILPKKAKRYLKHMVFKVKTASTPNLAVNGFEQPLLGYKEEHVNKNVSLSPALGENNDVVIGNGEPSATSHSIKPASKDAAWALAHGLKNEGQSSSFNENTILFVKPNLGAKLGDKVQIQITKFLVLKKNNWISGQINGTKEYNVFIAKIIKLNPISATQKKALVRASLRQMLKSGMHYGEKAIKCNARMKNYVWTRKKTTASRPFSFYPGKKAGQGEEVNSPNLLLKSNKAKSTKNISNKTLERSQDKKVSPLLNLDESPLSTMFTSLTKVQRGSSRGDLRPLIKKGRNIINLLKTRRCLSKALVQLTKYAVKGKTFLFVGTKKAASGLVSRAALFSKKAFFVNTRWLGGMLTNWKTILKSISKIRPILKEKQMIIKDILEKRQNIKTRLIQKALLLRKKSKLMLKKGRQLTSFFKQNKSLESPQGGDLLFVEKTNLLNNKRKEYVSKGIFLLEKQKQLFVKRQELISQSQTLNSRSIQLTNTYRQVLNNLMLSRKKLRELKSLLIVSNELHLFKQQAKQNNQNLYMVSYNKFKTLNSDFIIKNPPKEILNKMVNIIKGQSLIIKNNNLDLKGPNIKNVLSSPWGETGERQETLLFLKKGEPASKDKARALALGNTLILSQLLSKFSLFVPTIKASIKNLQTYISTQKSLLNRLITLLNNVKNKMAVYQTLKNKLVFELQKIKKTGQQDLRNIIRVLRRKLKQISAQKRLIKFLPKLRYLPTPANKIEQTARFLMKKFVDPKMKYPMDKIYDEKLSRQSKKVAFSRKKKWQRLEKYLGGISNMTKIKEKQIRNNVAIIIGQQEEMNAVRECQKLGIKMFHIVDTNCNPGFADHFIPANDDARNSIKFILGKFLTRIRLAQKLKIRFKKAKIKK